MGAPTLNSENMMKKTALSIAAFATLAGGFAAPAMAQGAVDPDLRCTAWAMVASAQEQDEGKKNALGFMMAYFAGRYEKSTGGKIETKINPQTLQSLLGDVDEANKLCGPQANSFGQRVETTLSGMRAQAAPGTEASR